MARPTEKPRTRREKFDWYYSQHPDKLNGKSLDEAWAGMRREVERKQRGGVRPADKGFVGPRMPFPNAPNRDANGKPTPQMSNAVKRRVTKTRPRNNGDVVDEKIASVFKKIKGGRKTFGL